MSFSEIVRAVYDSFAKGDIPAILKTLDDNVEWIGSGMGDARKNRTFRGHAGVAEFFVLVKKTETWKEFLPKKFVESKNGNEVFVLGQARGVSDPDLEETDWWFTHAWERDQSGSIVHVEAQWRRANKMSLLQRASDIYSCFGKGDIASIVEACSPDVEWTGSGLVGTALNKTFKGHDGVKKFFSLVVVGAHWKTFEPQKFYNVDNGHTLVVTGQAHGAVFGNPFSRWDFTHIWEFDQKGQVLKVQDQWRMSE